MIGLAILACHQAKGTVTFCAVVEVVLIPFKIGLALVQDSFKVTCLRMVLRVLFTIGLALLAVLILNVMEVQYHQALALHGVAENGLFENGPGCFKDLPRPGVGGGGLGDGSMDRLYGPWTGSEGGSMNTKSELPDLPICRVPCSLGIGYICQHHQ